MEPLALYGGPKTKSAPFGEGKRFGKEELEQLREALEQNTLFYWSGQKTKALCKKFAEMNGVDYCVAASSGKAAIHVALGALGIGVGDEVITSPVTDIGSVVGILYQNAVPVFADLDPHTYNLYAAAIEEKITPRTKAIIVVHLAGNPADMDPIMEAAHRHGIPVVEDCAQSYECYYKGRRAGTIGDMGCFSLNDFKHISAGDGGMVIMNSDRLYDRAFRFADKNYNRLGGSLREVGSLAPNYRMNELTAAVGLAQLSKVADICAKRSAFATALTERIKGLPGITPPKVEEGNTSSYWFYMLRFDAAAAGVDRDTFCKALTAEGIPATPGYIPACVYSYDLFQKQNAYPGSRFPFVNEAAGIHATYPAGTCPVAEEILRTAVRLSVSEFYTRQDLEDMAHAIRKVSTYFAGDKRR